MNSFVQSVYAEYVLNDIKILQSSHDSNYLTLAEDFICLALNQFAFTCGQGI